MFFVVCEDIKKKKIVYQSKLILNCIAITNLGVSKMYDFGCTCANFLCFFQGYLIYMVQLKILKNLISNSFLVRMSYICRLWFNNIPPYVKSMYLIFLSLFVNILLFFVFLLDWKRTSLYANDLYVFLSKYKLNFNTLLFEFSLTLLTKCISEV